MRRFAFGTLLCPEFSLRSSPRITVRGQTVQGDGGTLRKAPLRSSVDPWSTKRPCGPLAFRRATEGSRVLRRVWGSQEGAREPYGALAPFCPCRWAPTIPPPPGGGIPVPPKAAIKQRSGFRRSFAVFSHSMPFSAVFTSCICKSWSRSALSCSYRPGRTRSRSRPWQHRFRPPRALHYSSTQPREHR